MVKKKQFLLTAILSAGLIVFLILWVFSEIEQREYESYLSDKLVGQIVQLSHSPLYNLGILQDVIESEKITKSQSNELENSFRNIVSVTENVYEMGNAFGHFENYNPNAVLKINLNYAQYIMNLSNDMDDEIKLTHNQLEEIKIMEELMKGYYEIVINTLENTGEIGIKGAPDGFRDLYREKGITDDYWIELLEGYEKVTNWSYVLD